MKNSLKACLVAAALVPVCGISGMVSTPVHLLAKNFTANKISRVGLVFSKSMLSPNNYVAIAALPANFTSSFYNVTAAMQFDSGATPIPMIIYYGDKKEEGTLQPMCAGPVYISNPNDKAKYFKNDLHVKVSISQDGSAAVSSCYSLDDTYGCSDDGQSGTYTPVQVQFSACKKPNEIKLLGAAER